jgi:hypothetical protein
MYHIHLHRGLVYLFSHSQLGTTTDSLTSPPPMMMMMTAADSSPHDDDDDLGISRWHSLGGGLFFVLFRPPYVMNRA